MQDEVARVEALVDGWWGKLYRGIAVVKKGDIFPMMGCFRSGGCIGKVRRRGKMRGFRKVMKNGRIWERE